MAPTLHVINLDRDRKRMETVGRNLRELGLEFRRFPAVMGKEVPDAGRFVDAARYPELNHVDWPRWGELGCYLSHIEAMRGFLASGERTAVIMEDDVEFLPDAPECLAALAARDDWDMVKLFCYHGGTPYRLGEVARGRRLCVHLTRTTSTAAYMVNRRAAERLVSTLLPMREPIDHAHDRPWETGLRIRGLRPLVARLAETALTSSIASVSEPTPGANLPAKRSGRLLFARLAKESRRLAWALGEIVRDGRGSGAGARL